MNYGDTGNKVLALQTSLQGSGYPLPRFGPDGDFGGETLRALEAWGADVDYPDAEDGLDLSEAAAAATAFQEWHFGDSCRVAHPLLRRYDGALGSNVKRLRRWQEIDTIVLHQTGCRFGKDSGWARVPIHMAVPRKGRAFGGFFKMHPLASYLYHANGLNRRSVGIEIEGNFAGIDGDLSTHWAPGGGPDELLPEQIEGARAAVEWACDSVREAGGRIKFINAHRQASATRVADPGSEIWQRVALWAIKELALEDRGEFTTGKGTALPDIWTCGNRGILYR